MILATDSELLHIYDSGVSYQDIAAQYNFKVDSVRGRICRARKTMGVRAAVVYLDKPAVEPEPEPTRLEDLNDRDRWYTALAKLLDTQPFVRVMHPCDLHEPFSDPDVKEALLALVRLVQPDIIVRGSDEDDNPTISAWAEDGAEEPEIGDFLDTMQMGRNYNTRRLKAIAPRAWSLSPSEFEIRQMRLPVCEVCGHIHDRLYTFGTSDYRSMCQDCEDELQVRRLFETRHIWRLDETDIEGQLDKLYRSFPGLFDRGVLPDYWFTMLHTSVQKVRT